GLTPCALAIERQLQCVAPGGLVCVVACTIALIVAAEIAGLRPRPGLVSVRAGAPPSAKRLRQRITVGRLTASARAIRARKAMLCGVFCALAQRSNSARCSSDTCVSSIAGATRPTLPNPQAA